jgi:hypothetical protein
MAFGLETLESEAATRETGEPQAVQAMANLCHTVSRFRF